MATLQSIPVPGRQTPLVLGGRELRRGAPLFVIGEAGVNHNGDLRRALEMIDAGAAAGVDAVKFQMFRAEELTTASAPRAAYQQVRGSQAGADDSQRALLSQLELDPRAFEQLRERCRQRGVLFLATPFGVNDLARLLTLDPCAIKLASTDIDNVPLVEAAVRTGLPLIASTGAAEADEIEAAVARLREWDALQRTVLLHCVSSYPTPLRELNLRAVATLQAEFGVPAGLSDHTTDVRTGAWAAALGAVVLEKHFTLDRTLPGPDHAASLSVGELARYVSGVRAAEQALGDGRLGLRPIEYDVRRAARKSVVAARPIAAGTRLTPEMLTVKRPGGGISPARLAELVGRVAAVPLAADAPLSWEALR